MIQAKILGMLLKAILKHPKIKELFKYKDEPNELDIAVKEIKKDFESMAFKVNAMRDLFKTMQDNIDKAGKAPEKMIKEIEKVRSQIDDVKTTVSGFTGLFNKMKSLPLLKSVFK